MNLHSSSLAVGFVAASMFAGVAAAPSPAPVDPLAAVSKASPSTVADAANVVTNDSGKNAIQATVGGTAVTVPTDPSAGLKFGSATTSITIGLPFAADANNAVKRHDGVVSYDNNNGSTTV
jgi:hypothetical protein